MNAQFWKAKRVLITGHTGFKGSWLSLWLQKMGAELAGYALPAPTMSLYRLAGVDQAMASVYADIRARSSLHELFGTFRPEIVFHLAAQPLVRTSYVIPAETYEINVMGTIHVLEAVRNTSSCRVLVNVTSDKCYENKEWAWAYRESDALGGRDPYSSSKACAEMVTHAYRSSFFEVSSMRRVGVASARAGNVIGGGDFAQDRLVPDIMAAFAAGTPVYVRNPNAVRPWQHVLEPLAGYLLLAERLWHDAATHADAWNFGPSSDEVRPVRWILQRLASQWGAPVSWRIAPGPHPHEASHLALDSAKSRSKLGWLPRWTLEQALISVSEWYQAYVRGEPLHPITMRQISSYETAQSAVSRSDAEGAVRFDAAV